MRFTTVRRGFTLIELLVVIAIIGLLASIVLASLSTARAKARDAKRLADIESVKLALELYYSDNGKYPPTQSGPECAGNATCVGNLTSLTTGGYIGQLPADPTHKGTAYDYRYATDGTGYDIIVDGERLSGGVAGWCHPTKVTNFSYWTAYPACQ